MPDGEVAVRQDGHEHAVETPSLDGQVFVNLDRGEVPLLEVPTDVDVSFHDEPTDSADEDAVADGGLPQRTEVEMRGAGLDEDLAICSLIISTLMIFGAGYLLASGAHVTPIVVALGGGLLGYISARSFWSDRT